MAWALARCAHSRAFPCSAIPCTSLPDVLLATRLLQAYLYGLAAGGFQGARGNDAGGDFHIENVREELDFDDEFFFDKSAGYSDTEYCDDAFTVFAK